jgi:hypothetical protein
VPATVILARFRLTMTNATFHDPAAPFQDAKGDGSLQGSAGGEDMKGTPVLCNGRVTSLEFFFSNKAGVFRDLMVCGDDIYLWEDDSGCNICL